jgi:acyl carrier protein
MIADKVKEIVAQQKKCDVKDVDLAWDLSKDESIDSIDQVEIIMALEKEFKIAIEIDEQCSCGVVANLVKLVEEKL